MKVAMQFAIWRVLLLCGGFLVLSQNGALVMSYVIPAEFSNITCRLSSGKEGRCVYAYLCEDDKFMPDRTEIIDLRYSDDCEDLFLKCCSIESFNQPRVSCGLRNKDGMGFRPLNDEYEADYAEFPWMVAILKKSNDSNKDTNMYHCEGSLVHPQVVLTAAHCIQSINPHDIKVRLGEWDTETKNEIYEHQDRNVVDIVMHEDFHKDGLFNDVGLIFLDEPAEIMEAVSTICLPPQGYNFNLSRCFISGWGKDESGKFQAILRKIELPLIAHNDCQKTLSTTRSGADFILNNSFICAGGEVGKDTCMGDGGSPLVCPIPESDDRYYQAGIVTSGVECGTGIPALLTNVAGLRKWIDEQLTLRNFTHTSYIHEFEI